MFQEGTFSKTLEKGSVIRQMFSKDCDEKRESYFADN